MLNLKHTQMAELTFDKLPEAVAQLYSKLSNIEKLLQDQLQTSQHESDQLLTIKEAAEFLNLSVPTLYGYIHRQAIPASKRAGRLYFSKQELIDWVKAGRKKTTTEISAEAEKRTQPKRKGGRRG
jgi:excisionase family DNA binding protein